MSACQLIFVGANTTSTGTTTVKPDLRGGKVTYQADIGLRGRAKLASPAVTLLFERIGNDTENPMTTALSGLIA